MRTATLYTLKTTDVLAGDYVEFHQMNRSNYLIPVIETQEALLTKVEVQHAKVFEVRKIRHGVQTNHYIALERDLFEILRAPFVSELEAQARSATQSKQHALKYMNQISNFNNLPWHKRVWIALKGACI